MRLKSRTWMLISLVLFGAAALFWHWGDVEVAKRQQQKRALQSQKTAAALTPRAVYNPIFPLLSTNVQRSATNAFAYRLSNTKATLGQLERNNHAILLRNALIDTTKPLDLNIPENLKNSDNPGSWIVQSRTSLNNAFYTLLRQGGAEFVSYIPNNAALVSATAATAAQLKGNPMIQSVIPYEPYYKIDSTLLPAVTGNQPLTNDAFGVTFFAANQEETRKKIEAMGVAVLGEDRTPFGLELYVRTHDLVALAREAGVMEIEPAKRRTLANDLSRPIVGVASDSVVETNYLDLTGANIVVAMSDSGIDASHPDLTNRVFADTNMLAIVPNLLSDWSTNLYGAGHGTHVAGIIAGSGLMSTTVTNAQGSIMPSTNFQFRGKAPAAKLFIQPVDLMSGPLVGDSYLQENASKTNALIVNNSWGYSGNNSYSMASASYDAATRDAQPMVSGSQPLLFVFSAGNGGGGDDSGGNGYADSITAPATAKNVVTVGALESLRNITNEVAMNETTNAIWAGETDSDSQVASYSSRGNVGIGTEGTYGRFKPDVVAPGTFIVSTRSTQFQDPIGEATVSTPYYPNQEVGPGQTNSVQVTVPESGILMAVQIYANPSSPVPFPTNLTILAGLSPNPITPRASEFAVTPGLWTIGIANPNTQPVAYDLGLFILITNATGDMYPVLSNMNYTLGKQPAYYRYESGTSMAAPAVAGTLALMQEYFEKNHVKPSPALLKALLINGARLTQGDIYDYQVNRSQPNDEGWGVVNLTNSIPAKMTTDSGPTRFFDQSPETALATGQSSVRDLTISDTNAIYSSLRVTLVWSDPPGNPVAGIKLVNDLDLLVSNKVTGEIFVGNNFLPHGAYTQSNSNAPSDIVNNIENVYLDASYEPLGTNYAVIVQAKRVNVNAVTAHTNGIVQDYALVISSDCVTSAAPFTLTAPVSLTNTPPLATTVSNGVPLLYQRVGANSPLLGGTNGTDVQWHFFAFTNTYPTNADGTVSNTPYVALLTFMPPNLSTPRNYDADIDMYAVTNGNTNFFTLDTNLVAQADKSLKRGGNELLLYSNSANGTVYYVGIKSEDAKAAEFGFMAVASGEPFSTTDKDGNLIIRAVPMPIVVADGSPQRPQSSLMFFVPAGEPADIRRVTVQEQISHQYLGDLYGVLEGGGKSVVLNNHSSHGTNLFTFDDSGELKSTNGFLVTRSDGPGSLNDFMGDSSSQAWQFTLWDNAAAHDGIVSNLTLVIAPRPVDPYDFYVTLPAGGSYHDYIDVPTDATNLNISVVYSAGDSTTDISLKKGSLPPPASSTNGLTNVTTAVSGVYRTNVVPPGGSLNVCNTNEPPLTYGRWFYELYNEGDGTEDNGSITLHVIIRIDRSMTPDLVKSFTSTNTPSGLVDDALTNYTIYVPDSQPVIRAEVGVRLDYPRVSDLALTLTSPQGTRVMLFEDRGWTNGTALGFGTNGNYVYTFFTENTNLFPEVIKFAQPPYGSTNDMMITNMLIFASGFETNLTAWNYAATNYTNFGSTNLTNFVRGIYTNGQTVDGWTVASSNLATVVCDPLFTATNFGTNYGTLTASNYLALGASRLIRNVATVPGRAYRLNYAYRSPGISSWFPGDAKVNDLIGAGSTNSLIGYTNGMVDNAFLFNGGQSVQLPNVGNFGTNDFSIDFWIQTTNTGTSTVLTDGPLTITFSPATGVTASLGTNVTTGAFDSGFHHIAVVRHQTTLAIFKDGNAITNAGDAAALLPVVPAPAVVLGSAAFKGRIDELDLYNRALTPAEVWAIYQAGADGKYSTFSPMPNAQIIVDDFTNSIHGNSTNWLTNGIVFTAVSTNTVLQLNGSAMSPVFDDFILEKLAYTNYANMFLAEESLGVFKGENAQGLWTLGVWDTRTNAPVAATNAQLLSWKLQLTYSSTNVTLNALTNGAYSTNWVAGLQSGIPTPASRKTALALSDTVGASNVRYFAIDVPANAAFATNFIESLDPSNAVLNLLYNATGLPTGDLPGDALLYSGTNGSRVLTVGAPPFLNPGQRYFLAVVNLNDTAVQFRMRVDFDVATAYDITQLTNSVGVTNSLTAGTNVQYYSFQVSPISTMALFEVYGITNGDVDLVLSKDFPPPTPLNFDYMSANPGTSNEIIAVYPNSSPVPLSPGLWYLSVYKYSGTNVGYTVRASQWNTRIINLTNCISYTGTVSSTSLRYFTVDVPPWTLGVSNILTSSSTNLQLVYNQYELPLPGDRVLADTKLKTNISYYLSTNTSPTMQPGQRYYLWVNNLDPTNAATFTIQVQFVNPTNNNLTQLINGIPTNNTVAVKGVNYYLFNVPNNDSTTLKLDVYNLSGNADLVVRRGWPLPDLYNRDYSSAKSGSNSESIVVTHNSSVPLAQGDWYLAVYNSDTNAVSYTVRATLTYSSTPSMIVLTNQVPYTNTMAVGGMQYFAVDVPSDAYNVTNLLSSAGQFSLIFSQDGLPMGLPTELNIARSNVLDGYSLPALQTGRRYFLLVTNTGASAQPYALEVDYGVVVTPLTNGISLRTNIAGFNVTKYYSYDVTTNATAVFFDLSNMSSDLNLVAHYGTPLPNALNYHYQSTNSGTTAESIVVTSNSQPVALKPGRWYLGVYNPTGTNNAAYTIRASELGNAGTNFVVVTNGTSFEGVIPANSNFCFAVDAPANAFYSTNLLINLNYENPLSLLFNQYGMPATGSPGTYVLLQNVVAQEAVLATAGSGATFKPGQRYYLTVVNPNSTAEDFHLEVNFGLPPTITPLTSGIVSSEANTGAPQYYSFNVSSNAALVSFELRDLTGDVNLYVRKGLPLPGPGDYAHASAKMGLANEAVVLQSNAIPTLSPGTWYLAVINNDYGPVSYSILATETTSGSSGAINVIALDNGVPVTNAVVGAGFDTTGRFTYYRFTVTNGTPAMAFTVNDPGINVDLITTRGAYPSPQAFDAGIVNSDLATKLLVLSTNSTMPTLNGDWYLAVPNNSSTPATIAIAATLLPNGSLAPVLYNLTSTNSSFEFNWTTVPFLPYAVDVSPTPSDFIEVTNMTATSTNLYYKDVNSTDTRFYRVRELQVP